MTPQEIANACAAAAEEKKARDIILMDLQGISLIADYFVICTSANPIQAKAICNNIDEALSKEGHAPLHTEGMQDARWILMDFGSVIVHIFQEEERKYYNLERLWGDAGITNYGDQA